MTIEEVNVMPGMFGVLAMLWCLFGLFSCGDWYNHRTRRQAWPATAVAVMFYPLVLVTAMFLIYCVATWFHFLHWLTGG